MKIDFNHRSRILGLIAVTFLAMAWPSAVCQAQDDKSSDTIRIGVIGLDTSHSVAFTKLLNGENEDPAMARCKVTCAYPHGSKDIESSASRIPGYTKEMQELGIEIVESIDDLIEQVDAVLLETNDGRPHLEQVIPVLKAGKPVFVDKPIAASLVDTVAIFEASKKTGTPLFSSSSLRYVEGALKARKGELVGKVTGCETFSPCSLESTHPDLYWYGIHGVEQLYTVMGTGCESVVRISTPSTDVCVGTWGDSRVGIFRGIREGQRGYGGVVYGEKGQASTGGYEGYQPLVKVIAQFFVDGELPIDPSETIELYAFMSAADKSKEQGGVPVEVQPLIEQATKEANERLKSLGL